MQINAPLRWAAALAGVGLLLTLVTYSGTHLRQGPGAPSAASELVYLPKARYLRPLSLGYHTVLADLLWFRAISYFGQHYLGDRLYPWLADLCDIVTDLDPRAEHAYRFAGIVLPWEAGVTDDGIRLLEKGARALPDSWHLQFWLGFNYYFFKDDYAKAAYHMQRAAQLPDAHPMVAQFAVLFSAQEHSPQTTMAIIDGAIKETDRADIRAVLIERRKDLMFAADLDALNTSVKQYRERFGTPPPSLSALVDAQLLPRIPTDPYGGRYELDGQTGTVRSSSGRTLAKLHTSKLKRTKQNPPRE